MQKITNSAELNAAIKQLENEQALEWDFLKEKFQTTLESFQLSNIVKSTIKNVISGPGLKTIMVRGAIGFATGLLAKNMLTVKSTNPFKRVLGTVVKWL